MLTSPIYMLQVYDRVLGSQSEATLVALTLLLTALFLIMGMLDHYRGRILARIGSRIQQALDARAFHAALTRQTVAPTMPPPSPPPAMSRRSAASGHRRSSPR